MIKNDKQYLVTKSRMKDFSEAIETLQEQEMDPLLKELQVNSIKSQIEDFKQEIHEYESLKQGEVNRLVVQFDAFPEALIKGRIARGWTQADLADKLALKEQQIQRYEASNYATASLPRVLNIAGVIGLRFGDVEVNLNEKTIEIPQMDKIHLAMAQEKISERRSLIV